MAACARDFQVDLTFCWEDLKFSDNCVNIFLKSSKTDRIGRGNWIQIPPTGSDICPFRAMQQFSLMSIQTPHEPVFMLDNGRNVTKAIMDCKLKHHLAPTISHIYGSVSCHSLRAGAATTAELLGWTKTEIMGAGRWRSDSYNAYIALPQITRINHAAQLSFSTC